MRRTCLCLALLAIAGTNPLSAQPLAMREIADLRDVTPSVYAVALSPDGRFLAAMPERRSDIWLVDLRSGSARALGLGTTQNMAWGPRSDQLAFSRGDDNQMVGLYTISVAEGAPVRRVVAAADAYTPIYSPAGDSIAFVGALSCYDWECYRLFVVPVRGGEPREAASEVGFLVNWSLDGAWFYYGNGWRGTATYSRIPVTGGEAAIIASTGEHRVGPDLGLSPDDRFFAFALDSKPAGPTNVQPSDTDVYTIVIHTADGRELLRRVLPPGIVPQGWTAGNDVIGLNRSERKVYEIEVSSLLP